MWEERRAATLTDLDAGHDALELAKDAHAENVDADDEHKDDGLKKGSADAQRLATHATHNPDGRVHDLVRVPEGDDERRRGDAGGQADRVGELCEASAQTMPQLALLVLTQYCQPSAAPKPGETKREACATKPPGSGRNVASSPSATMSAQTRKPMSV